MVVCAPFLGKVFPFRQPKDTWERGAIMKKLVVSVLACLFLLSGSAYGGIVAHWSFNNQEDVGFDESGNNHQANINGDPTWNKGGLYFWGNNDYLEAFISPLYDLDTYTVCVRFKTSKKNYCLITRGTSVDTQHDNFFLRGVGILNSSDSQICGGHEVLTGGVEEEVKVNTEAVSPVNNNKWHEVWLTYDGATLKIYRDGILDEAKEVLAPGYQSGDDAPVRIGAKNSSGLAGDWFEGYIDDIKIYDEALAPPSIKILSAYVDYGFGANMNHFYPRDLMRFNIDYEIEAGDPDGQYRVVAIAFNKYPRARGCSRKKKRNKGIDIVVPGRHTLQFVKKVPLCAEPPREKWGDWIDVKWTLKMTTKLTPEDRSVVLCREKLLIQEALCVLFEP